MNKKIKIIITTVICIGIIGIGICMIFKDSNSSEKESKEFLKAIQNIQDEKYIEAYNEIKNSNETEKNMIHTILLNVFVDKTKSGVDIGEELMDEVNNIIDYLTYTYIYSKDSKYQANIDKIYAEKYPALYDLKKQIPKEILFDDVSEMYDLYFEYVEKSDGLFKDTENKIINDNSNFSKSMTSMSEILTKYSDECKKAIGNHPLTVVPDEYIILLGLNEKD